MPGGQRLLADSGYLGLTKQHGNSQTPHKSSKLHPLTGEQKAENRHLARERFVAEHIIRSLKIFRILAERYRNRRRRFGLRFNLIAAIYNLIAAIYNHELCDWPLCKRSITTMKTSFVNVIFHSISSRNSPVVRVITT